MKSILSLCLIFSHLLTICGTSFAKDTNNPLIVKNVEYLLSVDKSTESCISMGDVFIIMRQNGNEKQKLGNATVIYTDDFQCAMRIEQEGETEIQPGDFLVKKVDISESNHVLELAKNDQIENDSYILRDYYAEGKIHADVNYNSFGPFLGGLLSGFGLGALGWGVGFVYYSFRDIDVPEAYTNSLDTDEANDLQNGYSEKVEYKSKSNFSAGAFIGLLGFIAVAASIEN